MAREGDQMSRTRVSALGIVVLGATSGLASAQGTPIRYRPRERHSSSRRWSVTAQKSGAQSPQEVPLAIQAFAGEDLKEKNITSIGDLVSAVPGAFEGQRQSVASRSYNLRGAGGSNANGDSPIGYYLDDVPFVVTNFGIAPPVRFLDIERVEVLRGPQGTLYGQGSSGGVFIFHTRDPDLREFRFIGEAEVGSTREPIRRTMVRRAPCPFRSSRTNWPCASAAATRSTRLGRCVLRAVRRHTRPERRERGEERRRACRGACTSPWTTSALRAQYWRFRPRQLFTGFTASVDPPYFQNTAGQGGFANGGLRALESHG